MPSVTQQEQISGSGFRYIQKYSLATELLLKIILKRNDIKVIEVVGQREFKNSIIGGRNIRLDILAEDNKGKNYNIEVQRQAAGAHIRRSVPLSFHFSLFFLPFIRHLI